MRGNLYATICFFKLFHYFYSVKKVLSSICNFYVEGFRQMTWGRQLWWLILLKLIILFALLRLFFFRPAMADMNEQQKIEYVGRALTSQPTNNP